MEKKSGIAAYYRLHLFSDFDDNDFANIFLQSRRVLVFVNNESIGCRFADLSGPGNTG